MRGDHRMTILRTRRLRLAVILVTGLLAAGPVHALQCVPYAREASGIELRGDAWKWWNAAAGAYDRGHAPKLGAVVVFRKHGKMRLGHVAVVAKLIDARTMMIDHANWGPRSAGPGRISNMVSVRDVSPHNDWSEVQVWNALTRDFGTQTYPTYGFIYARVERAPNHGSIAATLPDEVAAFLASPSVASDGSSFDVAMNIGPLEPVPVPVVKVESIGFPAIRSNSAKNSVNSSTAILDLDRAAGRRSGPGRR